MLTLDSGKSGRCSRLETKTEPANMRLESDFGGFRDSNSARVRITETKLYQCDEIFVVTEIGRAITNKGVEDLVTKQLGKNFNSLKRSQGVTIICTKSEVLGQESEILRDIPRSDQFNTTILKRLSDQIEEAEDEGLPFAALKANRTHRFIYARNNHVKRKLIDRYSPVRKINVFCISNTLYGEAITLREKAHRRGIYLSLRLQHF
ncbi:hypothetical protein BGZ60DRAFT_158346 [Tricladium varicosporioides]|nr:hypothetical protein BGZ60DRAFT_158346 [Hymenoscyphus varicosporioides]